LSFGSFLSSSPLPLRSVLGREIQRRAGKTNRARPMVRARPVWRMSGLLGALINPGAHEADFLGRQRLGRRSLIPPRASEAASPAPGAGTRCRRLRTFCHRRGMGSVGSAHLWGRISRNVLSGSAPALLLFGRHRGLGIDPRNGFHDQAFLTVARYERIECFALVLAAGQHALECVEAKCRLGPLAAVAADTGRLK
jgi:hypothetical protein